jgi:outer membrane protein TolC
MKLIHAVGLAVLMLLSTAAHAQEPMNLTLEQCVETALQKNPEIRMAEKELSKARAGIGESFATLLPKVSASANFQRAMEIQENVMPNFIKAAMRLPDGSYVLPEVALMPDYLKIAFGIRYTFMYGATLTQPVFLGGAGLAGIKIAGGAKKAAEGTLEAKRQSLVFNTVNAFNACLLAREVIEVQEQAVAQAQANLDLVKKKFDAGTASGFDKMRAEVDLANLKPQLISARNGYQSAITGLRMLMGLPEETTLEIQGRLEYVEDGMDSLSLAEIEAKARQFRPEFSMLRAQQSMASGGVWIARSQFLPKVFFQTDYSFLGMRNDYHFVQDDMSKGFTYAFSVQIPLFGGFNNWLGYHKARMDYKIAKDSQKQLGDGIAAEVEISYHKFHESRQKHQSAKESIAMAEEAMRLANLMYEEGASTQLDVMGAHLALTQARLNFASSLYEYQMSRYGLRKSTGLLNGVL